MARKKSDPPAPVEATAAGAPSEASPASDSAAQALGSATYEIIRQRLHGLGSTLRERMSQLNRRRQEVFGSVEFKLLQADRVVTAHNCIPRDMVQLGDQQFLFGFNVQFGLKKEIGLADVFAIYTRDEASGTFKEAGLEPLQDPNFVTDFKRLYNVYEKAFFAKFSVIEGKLYMVFRVGTSVTDIAVFKWAFDDGRLHYVDGRAETEYRRVGFPPQYEFAWRTPDRESFRYGDHPHVSIEDRVFVECVGGDITIKVEDNTKTGEGIYSEPVEDKYQKVDDAEIAYAIIGHVILLKMRPYKENRPRYFIYNEKTQTAHRVDSIGQSCALLPEDHGLIFPDGYYLGTGELKLFESKEQGMAIERVVHSPNGEDALYVFYNRESGEYVLMPYRLIPQKVEERITCHGFSLFPSGHLLLFRAEAEPQKHHMIQLRQTPFYQPGYEPAGRKDAFLYQVGNKDVVRCLAECNEVLTLVEKEDPYPELYADLVMRCTAMLDAYPWLSGEDGFKLDEALREIRNAADRAVDEFDKVRRLKREAVQRVSDVRKRCDERFQTIRRASLKALGDYVVNLAALRQLRGELITLKEVRYVDLAQVELIEKDVIARTAELSDATVKFLLKPESLDPYRKQAAGFLAQAGKIAKVAEGRELEKAASASGAELEMLIEIVNSLKIEDATETTRIIDGITAVYSTLNQVKAALKQRMQELAAHEGAAQFAAQMKLLGQAAASYLDLCDTPARCDEYLNRLTVQIEELEGVFADFEEYTVQLSERRTELYEAFEQRKLALIEQRNRRAGALMTAAERILKVIQNRLNGFKTAEEINTYMASDLMVAKVREIIDQLIALEDSVKADDLEGRLKSAQQEAVRQLKDRQELFVDGAPVIQLGKHRFNVNTQPLDLTVVHRDGVPCVHLTSTKFFEEITDPEYLSTRDVWDQEVVSENADVYRSEYLAYQLLRSLEPGNGGADTKANGAVSGAKATPAEVLARSDEERLAMVQEFASARYQEGYTKGVHDLDAARIFSALLNAHVALELARYRPAARACASVFWCRFCPEPVRALWTAKLKGFSERNKLFPGERVQRNYIAALQELVREFLRNTPLYPEELADDAGEYLFHELTGGEVFVVSREAHQLSVEFEKHLAAKDGRRVFERALQPLAEHPDSALELTRDWVRGFLLGRLGTSQYLEEVTSILFCGDKVKRSVVQAGTTCVIEGMRGSHPRIDGNRYHFDYLDFHDRLRRFERDVVPRFERHRALKQQLLDRERARLRLDEFKPRVLTSFVRNQLIDRVYLPLIGDNLAKQIGAAGDQKRTDLMGLLLVVSPPGYGKTTLMEYIANRLGIVFVKINGPALGPNVTSLDPEEAPNAAAREEIQKLNLALEMGDNTMICVDDIQHCNPEFLQKFISLCDAQRKIEGVWRGQPRTYDLRGRKVVVVMAGNPYTESGQKFRIPDMLANRADTYNLGDIIGGHADAFKSSYIENAITSNPVLASLANKSQKDIRAFIRMAESGDRAADGFEGSYSSQEVEEILSVMKKLVAIREMVLRVNQEYIHSAAQADEFRTEPPFRLQGSYRNMNRLAEKVVPIMNDGEVRALVVEHYRNEAQTLTTGAEANLLKFKEIIGELSPEEKARWEEIKKTFKRNQLVRGGDQSDPVGRVVGQLSAFQSGLQSIQETLEKQLSKAQAPVVLDLSPVGKGLEALQATVEKRLSEVASFKPGPEPQGVAAQLSEGLKALREDLARAITAVHTGTMAEKLQSLSHELEMIHSTLATLKDLAEQQRNHLRNAQELLATRARQGTVEIDLTQEMLANEQMFLEKVQQVLSEVKGEVPPPETQPGEQGQT
ncbi:MAG TPA: AAA family ATPase [Verrucomicrobia bacterium]|nr:AAA family ATPase [Verrucomicrobiota bacterium]HOP98523.1 DNA repair ATPase [Verrucomicrobiota bacterium]